MTELASPKVCAVCGIVLSQLGGADGEWVHVQELVGQKDHVAIPVDYDSIEVRALCDFCHVEVKRADVLVVPAERFEVPFGAGTSLGHWSACETCGTLVRRRRWTQLVNRATDAWFAYQPNSAIPRSEIRRMIRVQYDRLQVHITGPVRPWQAGDEKEVPSTDGQNKGEADD